LQTRAARQYALFLALVAGVVAGGFWMARRPHGGVLDAVPRDAWLVLTVDAAALRASPLAQPLLGTQATTAIPGLGSLADGCGFDPLARLKDLVLCSPEGGERGDFGVAFTGDFTRDELARCADKVMHARGGSSLATQRGAFAVLEDAADPGHTRFAYRDGGPFLVGRGAWLDAMIDAAEGKAERMRPEHAALRASLAARAGEAAQPSVVLTALLPAAVRQRLRGELGAETAGEGERAYASVLAVAAAGLAVSTGGPGSITDAAAELRCDTPDSCAEVKGLLERKRLGLSKQFGVRLIGLGPLIDSLTVDVQATTLRATARASTDELSKAVKRVLDFRSGSGSGSGSDAKDRPPAAPTASAASSPPAPAGAGPAADGG
jgi:hypothetical protein